jgi:rare lipoprotein A
LEVHRFRIKRKRMAALALLPLAALTATQSITLAATTATGVNPIATTAAASRIELSLGKRNIHAGRSVLVKGTVTPAGHHTVEIDVDGNKVGSTVTGDQGGFRTHWKPSAPGVYRVEAIVKGTGITPVSSGGKRLNAYRAVQASYYGPGLYGGHLACGGTLGPRTLGVANKTLPCGTKVTLRHGSKTVTVPVIDRGPYSGNRVYDLTTATKNKLGFGSTGIVLATK